MSSADVRVVKCKTYVQSNLMHDPSVNHDRGKFSLDPTRPRTYVSSVRQVGPYLLSRRIGAGGMAEVWMAHRASLGASKTVALKLLAPNLASKPEYRKMFVEEARLSMLLNNSRLVQVFDAGEYAGECYIAMEWIDGINLAELQAGLWERGQRLPVDLAMFIAGEVLRALHYAHNLVHEGASSIVHRDVSPQNVMLSMAGEVKLADFGVARFATEETTGLHVKGKLRYMPPEQLQGNSRDATVDVFAVGAILHEMLDGRKFRGTSADDGQLLGMIFAGEIPELTDVGSIPAALDALRRGMLAPNARQRIPSAAAAVQALEHCPGYRNRSMDLETLVREHRRLITGDSSVGQGHRTGSFAQIVPAMPESQTKDTSVSRRVGRSENPGTGTDQRRSQPVGISRQERMVAAIIVALAGLGVGGAGMGFAIHEAFVASEMPEMVESDFAGTDWARFIERLEVALPVEEPSPEVPLPILAEPEPEPELKLEPEPAPEPEPVLDPVPTPPPDEAELEPKPKPKPPKPAPSGPPVKVTIAAGDFTFLYLKIGSKTYMLDPAVKLELPPGKHTMRIRENEKAKWQSISVEILKKPCRVVFKKPKTAEVSAT
jgi:serine/threonine protein kinase